MYSEQSIQTDLLAASNRILQLYASIVMYQEVNLLVRFNGMSQRCVAMVCVFGVVESV